MPKILTIHNCFTICTTFSKCTRYNKTYHLLSLEICLHKTEFKLNREHLTKYKILRNKSVSKINLQKGLLQKEQKNISILKEV